jgi:uncharacterized protein involved in exopolysaccharide biosynthesis
MNLDIVFDVLRKRWMQSGLLVVVATLLTGGILYFKKPYYLSTAVFTAANPNLGDRSNIYRTQFWEQYFYYGGEFDNDRLIALARSEEMCRFMVDSFHLIKHYKTNAAGETANYLGNLEFKENVRIQKNEFGHIKVNVWDTDKKLAAVIANAIVARTNDKSIASLNTMKLEILRKLQHDFNTQKDSLQQIELQPAKNDALFTARKADMISRINETEKLMQQFNTSINEVSALFIIEEALPALTKDKPKVLAGTIMAAVLSFIFSILLLLFIDWRSRKKIS